MAKAAKPVKPTIRIPFEDVVALLGKPPKDPAVVALLARAGKVKTDADFIIAKEAGFDYTLDRPPGGKTKVLSSVFLFAEGRDGHRGFVAMPPLGKGERWTAGGFELSAAYDDDGALENLNVQRAEAAKLRDVSTHPLHFETRPADAPPDAELVGMALLVAWAATKFGLPSKHAGTPLGTQLLARALTPRGFLQQACKGTLTTADFADELGDFLYGYTHRLFTEDRGNDASKIVKLLRLPEKEDRCFYTDDFLGTFADLGSGFYVPDSWAAVERIAPVLDARHADFVATRLAAPPKLALYQAAARARDAVELSPVKKGAAAHQLTDEDGEALFACLGKSLKDVKVKALLARAGLPIGKRIDTEANPAVGLAYVTSKLPIGGKKELGILAVELYAAGQTAYIGGLGAKVTFAAYPAKLPGGLAFGQDRKAVAKRLGKPTSSHEDMDYWETKRIRTAAQYDATGLVQFWTRIREDN